MNNTSVESYLADGCGRCDKFQTPECKVHRWHDVLVALREIMQASELVEEMKWGSPCYTLDGKNVAMIGAFKDECRISFFKGAAMEDDTGLLESAGPNSRHARLIRFRSVGEVEERRADTARLVQQATELERAGVTVDTDDAPEPMPEELRERLEAEPSLHEAFDALTPGRQRSFILYVSGAKQSATRVARADRCVPKILAGKGYNER